MNIQKAEELLRSYHMQILVLQGKMEAIRELHQLITGNVQNDTGVTTDEVQHTESSGPEEAPAS